MAAPLFKTNDTVTFNAVQRGSGQQTPPGTHTVTQTMPQDSLGRWQYRVKPSSGPERVAVEHELNKVRH